MAEPRPTSSSTPGDAPPSPQSLTAAIALVEALRTLLGLTPTLMAHVEQGSGLRLGQLRILQTVRDHGGDLNEIAAFIGEHPEAVRVTVSSLLQAGMLTATWPDGPTPMLHLTEHGQATLDQLAALHLQHAAEFTGDGHYSRTHLTLVRSIVPQAAPTPDSPWPSAG